MFANSICWPSSFPNIYLLIFFVCFNFKYKSYIISKIYCFFRCFTRQKITLKYDIIYTAPVFKEDGTYRVPPHVTVIHNGVVLQNNTTILGTTEYIGFPKVKPHGAGKIRLQSHGDPSEPISFRNIWIRKM